MHKCGDTQSLLVRLPSLPLPYKLLCLQVADPYETNTSSLPFPHTRPYSQTRANPHSVGGESTLTRSTRLEHPYLSHSKATGHTLTLKFNMAEGVFGSIIGGALAPIIKPVVDRREQRTNRRRQVSRPVAAIILDYITYECEDYGQWMGKSKEILGTDPWIKPQLQNRVVPIHEIGAPLIFHKLWQVSDAQFFEKKRVEIVGPEEKVDRLALILWGIHRGILKDPNTSARTHHGEVASGSQSSPGTSASQERGGAVRGPQGSDPEVSGSQDGAAARGSNYAAEATGPEQSP